MEDILYNKFLRNAIKTGVKKFCKKINKIKSSIHHRILSARRVKKCRV